MPKHRILKDFELTEISGVDRPAQPTATMSIIKRREGSPADVTTEVVKAYCNKSHENARTFAETLLADRVNDSLWPMTNALSSTIRSILEDGELSEKATAVGQAIDDFGAKMRSVVDDAESPLTKFAMNLIAGKIGDTTGEGDTMPKSTETELQKKLDDATTALAAMTLISKLNDDEKTFMEGMDDKARKAFTALTSEERKGKMDLAKRDDETLVVDGNMISKSVVGDSMFAVIKSQQTQLTLQADKVEKAQQAAVTATMTKRADAELGHLVGTAEEKAEVLKLLAGAPEEVRKTAEAIFKSADEMAGKAFGKQGHTTGQSEVSGTAVEKLDTLAKAHAAEHKVSYVAAYSEVVEKHEDLYLQTLSGAQ